MTEQHPSSLAGAMVRAVLEGGPVGLPEASRHQRVATGQNMIKVLYRNGYEHFERAAGPTVTDGDVVAYRWVARTKVAE